MLAVVLRYGGLLGLFLILFEIARRGQFTNRTSYDFYVVLIAVIFLGVGVALALAVARRSSRRDTETKKAMILDQGDLSDRERDVLLFLVHGYTNKEISSNLNITQNTVKSHLKNIYAKLGVTNRTQAAAEAKLQGFVGAP